MWQVRVIMRQPGVRGVQIEWLKYASLSEALKHARELAQNPAYVIDIYHPDGHFWGHVPGYIEGLSI